MATYQTRNGKTRAIVRRKGFSPKSRTFPAKTAAKTWADRVERELAALEAKGVPEGADLRIGDIDQDQDDLDGDVKPGRTGQTRQHGHDAKGEILERQDGAGVQPKRQIAQGRQPPGGGSKAGVLAGAAKHRERVNAFLNLLGVSHCVFPAAPRRCGIPQKARRNRSRS